MEESPATTAPTIPGKDPVSQQNVHLQLEGSSCESRFPEGKHLHISIWGHNDSPIQIQAVAVTQAFQDPGAKAAAGKGGASRLAWERSALQEEPGWYFPWGKERICVLFRPSTALLGSVFKLQKQNITQTYKRKVQFGRYKASEYFESNLPNSGPITHQSFSVHFSTVRTFSYELTTQPLASRNEQWYITVVDLQP